MRSFLLIAVLSLICACHEKNHKAVPPKPVAVDSLQPAFGSHVSDDDPEKIVKYHSNFDTAETVMENLFHGWSDSFQVDGQLFRLRYDTAEADYEHFNIEQSRNGKWNKTLKVFYLCGDGYGKEDMNNDGYVDFIKYYHECNYIYFYNAKVKRFEDIPTIMPAEYELLDRSRFLQFNFYEAMYWNPYPSSQLYTYKGNEAYFYYELLLVGDRDSDFAKMNLYQFRNGNFKDTVFIKTIHSGNNIDFGYKSYWKEHYKELMGYK